MLSENQIQCINLMVTENKTQKQIAKELKITEQTICNWKKDKEFKEAIEKNIKENFGSLALDAQKELKKLLKSNNEYIRIQAVKDILDRAGYKPTEKAEITSASKVEIVDDVNE